MFTPLPFESTFGFMLRIAMGMRELHWLDIVDKDLKSLNVLVNVVCKNLGSQNTSSFCLESRYISIADFQYSIGIMGTGLWRASKILLAIKEGCLT